MSRQRKGRLTHTEPAQPRCGQAEPQPAPQKVPQPQALRPPNGQLPDIAGPLLAWYDQHRRTLPFREDPTPYHVWVSEIMLQQTRVSAALPYYERFMAALPTVADLAQCPEEKLLKLWEGLGYYSRARNLQKAARIVMQQYGGQLPADYEELQKLPGIGAYTAGAVSSIAFGRPAPAVDGNVLRVFTRLLADKGDISRPDTRKRLTATVLALQPPQRPGDYNQALMELGALVCLPGGEPQCAACPLAGQCAALAAGQQMVFPVKAKASARKIQPYTVCLLLRNTALFSNKAAGNGNGCPKETAIGTEHSCGSPEEPMLLLTQRPAGGLLAGLWQPVLLEGTLDKSQTQQALAALGIRAQPVTSLAETRHIFTHLEWHMTGWLCHWQSGSLPHSVWVNRRQLDSEYALPTAVKPYADVARKCL